MWRGVAIESITAVDEGLDGGEVDVVDRGKVEDDGFEGGAGIGDIGCLFRAWGGLAPRQVLVKVSLEDVIWE